jgi:hypothetical protein
LIAPRSAADARILLEKHPFCKESPVGPPRPALLGDECLAFGPDSRRMRPLDFIQRMAGPITARRPTRVNQQRPRLDHSGPMLRRNWRPILQSARAGLPQRLPTRNCYSVLCGVGANIEAESMVLAGIITCGVWSLDIYRRSRREIFAPKPKGQRPVGTTPIVAWHEVPWGGVPRKNRPVGYGMIDAANPRGVSHRNVCRVS